MALTEPPSLNLKITMSIPFKKILGIFLLIASLGSIAFEEEVPVPLVGEIRTPPIPLQPRINGPRVYGQRPGRPFLYHLPVTGQRPITIAATGLPAGLSLDAATGNITGTVTKAGEYPVHFTARNALGSGSATLRIVIGDKICLTPPMGWNSWNCFMWNIGKNRIKAIADSIVSTGLIDHGWTYVNIDDGWETGGGRYSEKPWRSGRDAEGNILSKFGDMKAFADYIHSLGLKIGIYSSPGPLTCQGGSASYLHEDQDALTFANWGIDYLKYDLCSYRQMMPMEQADRLSVLLSPEQAEKYKALAAEKAVMALLGIKQDPRSLRQTPAVLAAITKLTAMPPEEIGPRNKELKTELNTLLEEARRANPEKAAAIEQQILPQIFAKMGAALSTVNRDIIYSLSDNVEKNWEWATAIGANLWRTTRDISGRWDSIEQIGFSQDGLEKWAGPGHWNDPDMLEIGNGTLTADECYTHMTLWSMLSAPLIIGCKLPTSPFVLSLFTNDEVLAVDQDELGKQGWQRGRSSL